jgi:hypothetical protein
LAAHTAQNSALRAAACQSDWLNRVYVAGPIVIVRTLLRACSAALLFRLAPKTSMKVL